MDTNMDNRRVRILQLGILALNVVSVMGLSIFIYATIENIRRSYSALWLILPYVLPLSYF